MNKSKKNYLKGNNGITLIALIVTIIILIILAGISINLVLGDNGIIKKAGEAKEATEQAQLNEQMATNELMDHWEELVGDKIPTIEELQKEGKYTTKKTTAKDSEGNIIKIPEGFKIATDSGINVTTGIVIEDKDIKEGIGNNRGNQYVWIPVGENIKKKDEYGNITEVDIELGRYIFADGINHKDEEGTVLQKGTPILKQSAKKYENEIEIHITEIDPTSTQDYEYKELKTNRPGVASTDLTGLNATALNLKGFVESIKANGGYYIARYEASYGVDGKANSKVSDNPNDSDNVPTTEGYLWNNITQINATTASRDLYKVEEKVTVNSDLMNSYAWDTAIVYIQEFSGDTDYSKQNSKNTSLSNTGVNSDEVCKINDMASNTWEWTTEYSTKIFNNSAVGPCTARGGYNESNGNYTSDRYNDGSYINNRNSSFRIILYM